MTPEEAIAIIEKEKSCIEISTRGQCGIDCSECDKNDTIMHKEEAYNMAIEALKEIHQYREIGTVAECREAVKKQKPKKPKLNYKPRFLGKATYTCPKCGNCCLEEFANERQNNNYCWDCGQAIQWDENLEGMEDEKN